MSPRRASYEAWAARRQEKRNLRHKHFLVLAWELLVESLASLLVETIEAAARVLTALAEALGVLSEQYKLWRRLSLAVALGIAIYCVARVFGHSPPVISDGTAQAFLGVAALVTAVAGLYLYGRNKPPGE